MDDVARARRVFDLIAPWYDLGTGGLVREYRKAVALLQERHPLDEQSTVLDVGTGTGALAAVFAEITPHVTGVDVSERMLALARRRSVKRAARQATRGGRAGDGGVRFLRVAAHELERTFGAAAFDVVATALVLHGLEAAYRRRVLEELRRVARQKVMIIDYLPHRNWAVALVERLEGSHYQEFLIDFGAEVAAAFPRVEVVPLSRVWGVYLCALR